MSVFNRKEGKKLIKDQLRLLKNKDSKDNNTKNNIKVQLETVQNLFRSVLEKDKPIDDLDFLYDYINEYREAVNLNRLKKLDKIGKSEVIERYSEKETIDARTAGILFLNLMKNDEFVKMANKPCNEIKIRGSIKDNCTKFVISFVKNDVNKEEGLKRYVFSCFVKSNDDLVTQNVKPVVVDETPVSEPIHVSFVGQPVDEDVFAERLQDEGVFFDDQLVNEDPVAQKIDDGVNFADQPFDEDIIAENLADEGVFDDQLPEDVANDQPVVFYVIDGQPVDEGVIEEQLADEGVFDDQLPEDVANDQPVVFYVVDGQPVDEDVIEEQLVNDTEFDDQLPEDVNVVADSQPVERELFDNQPEDVLYEQVGPQNEDLKFYSPKNDDENKSRWEQISKGISNYFSDSKDYIHTPREFRHSHKTIIDSPSNKSRPIPIIDDQFYSSEKFIKISPVNTNEPVNEEAADVEGIPFLRIFRDLPANTEWHGLSKDIPNYSDSKDYIHTPRQFKHSHKTVFDAPSNKQRPIPVIDDQFYSSETFSNKNNNAPKDANEPVNEEAADVEGIPFLRIFRDLPANTEWHGLPRNIPNYSDSKDYIHTPRQFKHSHKTVFDAPSNKQRPIPVIDDQFYSSETFSNKNNNAPKDANEPAVKQTEEVPFAGAFKGVPKSSEWHGLPRNIRSYSDSKDYILHTPRQFKHSHKTVFDAPSNKQRPIPVIDDQFYSSETFSNKNNNAPKDANEPVNEEAADVEEIPFSALLRGVPANTEWHGLPRNIPNYSDSKDYILHTPRQFKHSHKTVFDAPSNKQRPIPVIDDQFYSSETFSNKNNNAPKDANEPVNEEAADVEGIPFLRIFRDLPANTEWHGLPRNIPNYSDSKDYIHTPRQFKHSHKTVFDAPSNKQRPIPVIDDQFYSSETFTNKNPNNATKPSPVAATNDVTEHPETPFAGTFRNAPASSEWHGLPRDIPHYSDSRDYIHTPRQFKHSHKTVFDAPSNKQRPIPVIDDQFYSSETFSNKNNNAPKDANEPAVKQTEEVPFAGAFKGVPKSSEWHGLPRNIRSYSDSKDYIHTPRQFKHSHKTVFDAPSNKQRPIPVIDDQFYSSETFSNKNNNAPKDANEPVNEEAADVEGIPFLRIFRDLPANTEWHGLPRNIPNYSDSKDYIHTPRQFKHSHKTVFDAPSNKQRPIPVIDDQFYSSETFSNKNNNAPKDANEPVNEEAADVEGIPFLRIFRDLPANTEWHGLPRNIPNYSDSKDYIHTPRQFKHSHRTVFDAPSNKQRPIPVIDDQFYSSETFTNKNNNAPKDANEPAVKQTEEVPFAGAFKGVPKSSEWHGLPRNIRSYSDSRDYILHTPRQFKHSHKTVFDAPSNKQRPIPVIDDQFYSSETFSNKNNNAPKDANEPVNEEAADVEGIPFLRIFRDLPANTEWHGLPRNIPNYSDSKDYIHTPRQFKHSHKTVFDAPSNKQRPIPVIDDQFYSSETFSNKNNNAPKDANEPAVKQTEEVPFAGAFKGVPKSSEWHGLPRNIRSYSDSKDYIHTPRQFKHSHKTVFDAPSNKQRPIPVIDDQFYSSETFSNKNNNAPKDANEPVNEEAADVEGIPFLRIFRDLPANTEWHGLPRNIPNYSDSKDYIHTPHQFKHSHRTVFDAPSNKQRPIPVIDDQFYSSETFTNKNNNAPKDANEPAVKQTEEVPFAGAFKGVPKSSEWHGLPRNIRSYSDSKDYILHTPRQFKHSHKTVFDAPSNKQRPIPVIDDQFYSSETFSNKNNNAPKDANEPVNEEAADVEGIPFLRIFRDLPANTEWHGLPRNIPNYSDSKDYIHTPHQFKHSHRTVFDAPSNKQRPIPVIDDQFYSSETFTNKNNNAPKDANEPAVKQTEEVPFAGAFKGVPKSSEWHGLPRNIRSYSDSKDYILHTPRQFKHSHKTVFDAPSNKQRPIPVIDDQFYSSETFSNKNNNAPKDAAKGGALGETPGKATWANISKSITKYDDSEDYENVPKSLKSSHHRTSIDVPSNKPRPIPDIEDQFYDSETFIKSSPVNNSSQKQHKEKPAEIPMSLFTPKGDFGETPQEKAAWNLNISAYDDSRDYKNVPDSLKSSHKVNNDSKSRHRKDHALEDDFYDSETFKKISE